MNPLINLDDAWGNPEKAAECGGRRWGKKAPRHQGIKEEESDEP